MRVNNTVIPTHGTGRWDVQISQGRLTELRLSEDDEQNPPSLLLPSLCSPHVHLDKPYILTCNHGTSSSTHPDYSDLIPKSGSFSEALASTSKAKERYTADDLYLRGSQLLATSYKQGVTSLRAFVEIDHVTGSLPLETAIKLKKDFGYLVEIQICAFAQDPLFSSERGESNRLILGKSLKEYSAWTDALGTTPYVEKDREASLENIEWAIRTALEQNLHLDFHVDYNLGTQNAPLTYSIIDLLLKWKWPTDLDAPTIVLGHCTQLTTLNDSELYKLSQRIRSSQLPIHFVGLPTSDLFMMGRPGSSAPNAENSSQSRPRGTLQVVSMINDLGLSACMGVNNVGNSFTPWGTGDPLQLACLGVGIYQAGTPKNAETLFSCVSWRARKAIGLHESGYERVFTEGDEWQPMLLVENRQNITLPGRPASSDNETPAISELLIPWRQRFEIKDVIWDPPEINLRSIFR